ncbi:hypothetical protein LPJ59_001740, partial [Coemansia sp. RSA 2399]
MELVSADLQKSYKVVSDQWQKILKENATGFVPSSGANVIHHSTTIRPSTTIHQASDSSSAVTQIVYQNPTIQHF